MNRAKYSHLVDSDEAGEETQAVTLPTKMISTSNKASEGEDRTSLISDSGIQHLTEPSKSQPRDRRESNSSYAEEDHPSVTGKRLTKSDFNYQELDDEFGSRPVDPAAVPLTVNAKQNSTEVSPGPAYGVSADRIVGHEYGVRPLLDDDELQESFTGQIHGPASSKLDLGSFSRLPGYGEDGGMTNQGLAASVDPIAGKQDMGTINQCLAAPVDLISVKQDLAAVASEPAKADVVDKAAMTTSSSSVISPDMDSSLDVFSAAPFRPRPSKRSTPQQVQASGTSSASSGGHLSNVFESAPFRMKSSKPASSGSSTVTSPGSSQLQHSQDMFGSAPFSPTASSILTPSSSTVSPSMEDIMYIKTPDEAQPGSLPSTVSGESQQQQQMSGGAVPVRSESSQRPGPGVGAGGSGTSFDSNSQHQEVKILNPALVPYTEITKPSFSDDPFGAVPWNKALKRSVKKNRIASSIPNTLSTSLPQGPQGQAYIQPSQTSNGGHQATYFATGQCFPPNQPTHGFDQCQQLGQVNIGNHQPRTQPEGQAMPSGNPEQGQFTRTFNNQPGPQQVGTMAMRPDNLPMPAAVVPTQVHASGAAQSNLHQQQQHQQWQQQQKQKQLWDFNNPQGDQAEQPDWVAMRNNCQDDGGSYQRLRTKTEPPSSTPSAPHFHQQGTSNDGGSYQRLRTKTEPSSSSSPSAHYQQGSTKRSSRDVSTAAFANMSFNDEDEVDATSPRESPLNASYTAPPRVSPAVFAGTTKGKASSPAGLESGRTVVVAAVQSAGYDTGTWPRKHRRHQAKAEPFSVSKKL